MIPASHAFKERARAAMADPDLTRALTKFKTGFPLKRAQAVAALPEFEALRDEGKRIKDHALAHLDLYLERFEAKVTAAGGQVHWARTPAEARAAILSICRAAGARMVTKGKSMVSEEVGLNAALEEAGLEVVETDLGEYIIQIRKEAPSHIIAPALHLSKEQVAEDFRRVHTHLDPARSLSEPSDLLTEARVLLREKFLAADVGITGANFLIAETGSTVIVTNEGNGDLTQSLPRVHVVLTSIEKVVPTLEDASTLLRLLARSATGQELSTYTTFSTGPRRPDDLDGPEQFHVVLLDNGRSALLGTEMQEALRCIRCGACMNHCPVYHAVGGHAYGWVYPGPIGAVIDPALIGLEEARHLPNASTFCGRCESVCPVRIPLPRLMRLWREKEAAARLSPGPQRWGLGLWAFLARRPGLYRLTTRLGMGLLGTMGGRRGRFRYLPLAGGWTGARDFPAPTGRTFQDLYRESQRARP
ncbi:LutB/LldF family L-lactate oxidation iron-sulfur protein [Oleisolibacter albus]|uniref:LutB/LldF family L-lactate oxidation iron-sulfur protein n=1 Tax=Oleisolibacter albus TaxID=2171757 RepID=UPI000DF32F98|nr:LutB/LldF family L-lactate oxidation iron-sulfur protein [Oleisolibacter albus]